MNAVEKWNGAQASALRGALRMSNEAFAGRLGASVRTVARWNADPDVVPMPEMQRALDTLLARSTESERERFEGTGGTQGVRPSHPEAAVSDGPALTDRNLTEALDWLDRHAGWVPGTAWKRVRPKVHETRSREHQDLAFQRARVQRDEVTSALAGYYGNPPEGHGLYAVATPTGLLRCAILTSAEWTFERAADQALQCQLSFTSEDAPPHRLSPDTAAAGVSRLAEVAIAGTQLVNERLYRLTRLAASRTGLSGTVSLDEFVAYALTLDLLEGELLDALATGKSTVPGTLPLRDAFLPDLPHVLAFRNRLCAGGPSTLTAIARPATGRRPRDYVFLVQQRSGQVLNAAGRLSVIPRAFHEPFSDPAEDADLAATVEREMEEELFGRHDVDSTVALNRSADPMHRDRLSEPMRWLDDHRSDEEWRVECTGLGINLINGNYEASTLLVVENEEWWARFGGSIEANWESESLRRYSTKQPELITSLLREPGWSNEGLFALLQGLRTLGKFGADRVDIPSIELEEAI